MPDTNNTPADTRFPFAYPLSRPLRIKLYRAYVSRVIDLWAAETSPTDIAEIDKIELAKRTRYLALGIGDFDQFYRDGEGLDASNYGFAVACHQQAGAQYPQWRLVYDSRGRCAGDPSYGRK